MMEEENVMAAWERLDELLKQRDRQVAEQERDDRLWEMGDFRLVQPQPEEPSDGQ